MQNICPEEATSKPNTVSTVEEPKKVIFLKPPNLSYKEFHMKRSNLLAKMSRRKIEFGQLPNNWQNSPRQPFSCGMQRNTQSNVGGFRINRRVEIGYPVSDIMLFFNCSTALVSSP